MVGKLCSLQNVNLPPERVRFKCSNVVEVDKFQKGRGGRQSLFPALRYEGVQMRVFRSDKPGSSKREVKLFVACDELAAVKEILA